MPADTEHIYAMGPMLPEEGARELEDLAVTLVEKASALAGRVNPLVVRLYLPDIKKSCSFAGNLSIHFA